MEMYFKRMKDEWTGLVEQADPPIRAKAAEIAVAHAHYLSIEFYRIVRIDPHAEEFLSNEQVERQLKSAMERWIINVLSAQVDDVERLIQIQHTVAEVHARIGISGRNCRDGVSGAEKNPLSGDLLFGLFRRRKTSGLPFLD